MTRWLAAIAVFVLIASYCSPASGQSSYLWDATSLLPLYNTVGIACSRWTIWYFRSGASQIPGTQWGSSTGDSPEVVLEEQKKLNQGVEGWEQVKAKYHIKGLPPVFVYDNYLGPICVTNAALEAKSPGATALTELSDIAEKISNKISKIQSLLDAATGLKEPFNPYSDNKEEQEEKSELEQYVEILKKNTERINQLEDQFTRGLSPSIIQINKAIDEANADLANAEATGPKIQALLNAGSDLSWTSNHTIQWDSGATNSSVIKMVPGGIEGTDRWDNGAVFSTSIPFALVTMIAPPSRDSGHWRVRLTSPGAFQTRLISGAPAAQNYQSGNQPGIDYGRAWKDPDGHSYFLEFSDQSTAHAAYQYLSVHCAL